MANKAILRIAVLVTAFLTLAPISAPAQETQSTKAKNPCKADERYYKDRDRGWYHNEQCIEPEPEPEKEKPTAKAPQQHEPINWEKIVDEKYLNSITAAQFRKLLTDVKEEAVYNPTPEKVHTYMILQDYARRKSVEFAYVWRDQLLKNPSIDMTAKWPASNFGAYAINRKKAVDDATTMAFIKERVGVLLFVSGECSYCWDQIRAMNLVVDRYAIAYKTYAKDFCPDKFQNCEVRPELFEKFSVTMTPAIVAVFRDENDRPSFQPISNGLIVAEELINRLVFYYNYVTTGQHPSS